MKVLVAYGSTRGGTAGLAHMVADAFAMRGVSTEVRRAGDIRDLDDPALRGAELYVKQVHTLDGKQQLFAFSIPFDNWLKANPSAPSNRSRQ